MKHLSKAFLYSCILALFTVISVSLFWQSPVQLTLILFVISVVMLLISRDREDLLLYTAASFWGALSESLAVAFGAWTYPLPDILGIPIWLFLVWGIAGVFIKRIYLVIHEFLKS